MRTLWPRPLVSPPAIWGKLPSHADYVRHHVGYREDAIWQDWLLRELGERAFLAQDHRRRQPRPSVPWVQLDVPPTKPGPGQVPISFALPSRGLHHGIEPHVIGVVARSADSRGRVHPLIVYQFCSERWLRQCFAPPSPDGQTDRPGWLHWLSRLVVRYTHGPAPSAMPIHQAVDELWRRFAPGWLHGLGIARKGPSATDLDQWLQTARVPGPPEQDAMQMLHGVRHLPWLDWPHRIWKDASEPGHGSFAMPAHREAARSYWQHDAAGGYVGAAGKLAELWD